MATIEITAEGFEKAGKFIPPNMPLVMINLLRYREFADYSRHQGASSCSGREAYRLRYLQGGALEVVRSNGGSVLWFGRVLGGVICPPDERWDDALLVQYPASDRLMKIYANPAYQAIAFHRTAALDDSRLIATITETSFG